MPTEEHKIAIVPYDPAWPAMFEAEAARLRAGLKTLALRIDHHGSTAIPGLAPSQSSTTDFIERIVALAVARGYPRDS